MKRNERINDPTLAWLQAFAGAMAGVWTALPCIVESIDADMTVSCQPAVQAMVTDPKGERQLVTMPLLIKCPLIWPSGGGFTLTFPVKPGDEVLVVFASRCIDSWWQNGGLQAPAELRMHDLSDGFALPGPKSVPRSFAADADNVQLRSDDGDAVIEITPAHAINITTTGNVAVAASGNASVQASGTMTLQSSGDMTIQAPNLNILGNVSSTGTFSNNGKAIGSTHYHTAQGATANTTTPKPP